MKINKLATILLLTLMSPTIANSKPKCYFFGCDAPLPVFREGTIRCHALTGERLMVLRAACTGNETTCEYNVRYKLAEEARYSTAWMAEYELLQCK